MKRKDEDSKRHLFVILLLSAGAMAAGCGGGGGEGTDATIDQAPDADIDIPDSTTETGCPDRLSPVEPTGQLMTVGDGTTASCTEAALRQALDPLNAGSGGTITFNCGGKHTITLTSQLTVSAPLTIDGGGEITLSGGRSTRVLEMELGNAVDLVVQRITIADGTTEESGAGIEHPWFGTLKAIDVIFVNNHCTSRDHDIGGGAVFAGGLSEAVFSGCVFAGNSASNGGGLLNRGSNLAIIECVFSQNVSTSSGESGQYGNGGGLYIDGMNYDTPGDFHMCGTVFENNNAKQHGSAVFSYFYPGSNSYVDRCLFRGNNFDGSPTGGAGGFYHETNLLTMTNSTFADNRSEAHASAIFIGSGSTAEISNCTFTGNRTHGNGAGIFDGASPLNITNCTFSGNDADYGPAIFKGEGVPVSVTNTIFANNTTANRYSALSCHETLDDGGGNVQWPRTKPISGSDDMPCVAGILFADPLLQPLADNGGPTPTMALSAGSPAIDVADDCPAADQRGMERVGRCDAGAYEYQP